MKKDATSAGSKNFVSKDDTKISMQSLSYNDSHPTGPIALQSSPTTDELCTYPDLHPGENIKQIRNSRELEWWIDLKKAPHGYQCIT